ncbi:hypothetical protein RND81_04G023900 [Saponaria officinalis]|uniref:Uncharacterized protein n=1 Tax=Saponaria officinalis TaxID=3572 RepID=A0AAW1LFR6_SAPOF
MAGISCYLGVASTSNLSRIYTTRCCSNQSTRNSKNQTPQLLKFAVSGITEILRIFSSDNDNKVDKVIIKENEELSVSGVDDVVGILKSDYDNAYFVTGMSFARMSASANNIITLVPQGLTQLARLFSSSVYTGDCLFEDPTIKFRGTDLYSRNLQLLVPFFEQPSIVLKSIEKGNNSDRDFVLASWSLRTFLKLPWRPLIAVEGKTVYDLNDEYKIVRHSESWNITALEAVGQIFTPGFRRPSD